MEACACETESGSFGFAEPCGDLQYRLVGKTEQVKSPLLWLLADRSGKYY